MELTTKAIKIIDKSNKVKGMLADKYGKTHTTIQRWVVENDAMLTTADSILIFKSELQLTEEDLFGTQPQNKA